MKHIIFALYFVLLLKAASCANKYDEVFKQIAKPEFRKALLDKSVAVWNWAKEQTKFKDSFVGRCFGIGKKLSVIIPITVFSLGVIITTLKFLTLFTLKGVTISVLLLIMNVAGWAGKIGSWKSQLEYHRPIQQPQNVHFHIHKDKDQYAIEHSGPSADWYDRMSDGLSKTTSLAEKIELLNLYKRLGLNPDQSVLSRYR